MNISKIHYKNDIPPIRVTLTLGGVAQLVPSHDFALRFFTENPKRFYTCYHVGGEWKSMKKTGDMEVECYVKNPSFGPGRLHCVYLSLRPSEGYDDGICRSYSASCLNVELVEDNGDDVATIDAEIALDLQTVINECIQATDNARGIYDLFEPIYKRFENASPEDYHTKTEINELLGNYVPVTRKVNDKTLDKDITLRASSIPAYYDTNGSRNTMNVQALLDGIFYQFGKQESDFGNMVTGKADKTDVYNLLESMGDTIDNDSATGDVAISYMPNDGDVFFNEKTRHIYRMDGDYMMPEHTLVDLGAPSRHIVYFNRMTSAFYRWTGTTFVKETSQGTLTAGEGIVIERDMVSATHETLDNWDIDQIWEKTEV